MSSHSDSEVDVGPAAPRNMDESLCSVVRIGSSRSQQLIESFESILGVPFIKDDARRILFLRSTQRYKLYLPFPTRESCNLLRARQKSVGISLEDDMEGE